MRLVLHLWKAGLALSPTTESTSNDKLGMNRMSCLISQHLALVSWNGSGGHEHEDLMGDARVANRTVFQSQFRDRPSRIFVVPWSGFRRPDGYGQGSGPEILSFQLKLKSSTPYGINVLSISPQQSIRSQAVRYDADMKTDPVPRRVHLRLHLIALAQVEALRGLRL